MAKTLGQLWRNCNNFPDGSGNANGHARLLEASTRRWKTLKGESRRPCPDARPGQRQNRRVLDFAETLPSHRLRAGVKIAAWVGNWFSSSAGRCSIPDVSAQR